MRYSEGFGTFKTRTWRRLWESNIPDLESLLKNYSKSGFVAVDTEPYATSQTQVTEIGLSYIPPLRIQGLDEERPPTIKSLGDQYGVQSRCFRVSANERREKKRGPYEFGTVEAVAEADIEHTLVDAVASLVGSNPKPVLIGFSLSFELQVITMQWPRLVDMFSAWVDLQEIADDVSGVACPGMRDTLSALGFGQDFSDIRGLKTTHNAGNDAMRVSAMLLRLGALSMSNLGKPVLDIKQTIRHKNRAWNPKRSPKERTIWKTKPTPRELYPFIARVSVSKQLNMFSGQGLMDVFSKYSPTAVGIAQSQRYGWVCLKTLEDLGRFVDEVNATPYGDFGTWMVFEHYDPAVVPVASPCEIIERRRAEQEAQAEEKRRLRIQRRQRNCEQDDEELAKGGLLSQ